MKKIRTDIFNYFIIIVLSVFIGTLALFIAYLLPQEKISNHVLESVSVFEKEDLYYEVIDGFETTKLDNFTDCLILDELNYNGKEKALKKAMSGYGYTNNSDPIDVLVKIKQDKQNDLIKTTYERYWHGNNVIYKILFYFFNYQEVRMLNTLLLCLLLIFLIKVICFSRIKRFLPCFILSLLIINPFIMGLSLQYFVCYIIMLIASIIVIKYYDKIGEKINYLFLIIGIITSYFDLLTFPLLTLSVPLIFYILLTSETDLKKLFIKAFLLSFSLAFGYFLMWIGKWVIGSVILKKNLFIDALNSIKERVKNDVIFSRMDVINQNLNKFSNHLYVLYFEIISCFYFIKIIKNRTYFDKKLLGKIILLALVFFFPFVWYFVLSNHSYIHSFFTHKILMISVFSILSIFELLRGVENEK